MVAAIEGADALVVEVAVVVLAMLASVPVILVSVPVVLVSVLVIEAWNLVEKLFLFLRYSTHSQTTHTSLLLV